MLGTAIDLKLAGELPLSTPIWRYMRISTLLYLLMEERSFVPKLSLLRQDDVNEGCLSFQEPGSRVVFERHEALKEAKDWLLRPSGKDPHWRRGSTLPPDLVRYWHDELADRRCVWCWHESQHECMAQWRIYAREGVAIRSDVQSVLKCLSKAGDIVYGRIKYKNRQHQTSSSDGDGMIWFPYFVKQDSYSHEHEVRFAFQDDAPGWKGRSVETKVRDLIKEVRVAPYIVDSEATSVVTTIRKLLPENLEIDVGVSGERSGEPWPRQESTVEERFEHALGQPFVDATIPKLLHLLPNRNL
jgi:hypothetical protein